MPAAAEPKARLRVDGDALALSGDLRAGSAAQLLEQGRAAIAAVPGTRAALDLSLVTRSDSAGLALVVDWIRAARRRGLELDIRGVPRQLAEIARVSGLDSLLGVAGEADAA